MPTSSDLYQAGLRHLEEAAVAWAERFATCSGARIEVRGWQPEPVARSIRLLLAIEEESLLLRVSDQAVYASARACESDQEAGSEAEFKKMSAGRRWLARPLGQHLREPGFETRDPTPGCMCMH
jgi:hypothetical protein